jgi:putative Holliday junction resolvase
VAAVLAIDVGTKRSGFAVTDALRILTQPLAGCAEGEDSEALFAHIERLLSERDVDTLLVGLPLDMNGGESARAKAVRGFAGRLRQRFPRPAIVLWDERLTTRAAQELLAEAGYSGRESKAQRDSFSALVLLRDWLESGAPNTGR